MRLKDIIFEEKTQYNLMDLLDVFVPFIIKEYNLAALPKIKLVAEVNDAHQPTFGKYENDTESITLGISKRHPLDVIRTLAHELAHYRQDTKHELGPHSGETGSPQENEAHALAGIAMRHFDKRYPQFFDPSKIVVY